jgi:hypothetical protein
VRHDRMVGLVETMMTADSLQLTAYGPAPVGRCVHAALQIADWGNAD